MKKFVYDALVDILSPSEDDHEMNTALASLREDHDIDPDGITPPCGDKDDAHEFLDEVLAYLGHRVKRNMGNAAAVRKKIDNA